MFGEWLAAAGITIGSSSPALLERFKERVLSRGPAKHRIYKSADINCIAAAVATREAAIAAGFKTHADTESAAYTARAAGLADAYAASGTPAIKAAVKKTWDTFRTSSQTARKTWQKTRDGAWSQFRTAARDCGAPADVIDTANAGSEPKGE